MIEETLHAFAANRRRGAGKGDARGRPKRRSPRSQGAAPLILIVDDVEDNRELYAQYIEYVGWRVDQATDGEEALTKIARARPDLVIMDLQMPKLDGWEATRRIKSSPLTEAILVVVVTSHATPNEIRRALAAGADDVCTKPCLPSDVFARVRRLLER